MKGEVAWELEEIEKVAAHFGETFGQRVCATEGERLPRRRVAGRRHEGGERLFYPHNRIVRWRPSPGSPAA
jgi:hypothetical protein